MRKTAYGIRISDWSSDVCSSVVRLRRLRLIEYRLLLGRVGCGLREAGDAYPFAIRVRVASRASLVIVDGTPRVLLVDHIDELLRYSGVLVIFSLCLRCLGRLDRKSTRLNSSH